MCGLDIAPVSYIGGAVGGGGGGATPDYSVATFSLLPSDATVGQRVAVTGESGLSGVVCVNTAANTWELEAVACSFSDLEAVARGVVPGRWYSSGGITVGTSAGAVSSISDMDGTPPGCAVWIGAVWLRAASQVQEPIPARPGDTTSTVVDHTIAPGITDAIPQ